MDKNHLLILIFLALISVEEMEPCVKPEHVPEMPYSAPSYSLRPVTVVATTTATTLDMGWLKKL